MIEYREGSEVCLPWLHLIIVPPRLKTWATRPWVRSLW